MREGQFEYIHEFKERINEIIDLQKKHHQIIDSTNESTIVKQASMSELHRLNITLSNYYDVLPTIIGYTVPAPSRASSAESETGTSKAKSGSNIIV